MVIHRAVFEAGQYPRAFLNAEAMLCTSLKDNVKHMQVIKKALFKFLSL
jgi:hypothetical protein